MGQTSHSMFLSRRVGAIAATVVVGIFAGCMSFSIGGKTSHHVTSEAACEDGVYLQQGVARVKGGHDVDVFYPVTYQRPPNLELGDDADHCEIVEQREDHFKLHNSSAFKAEVQWKARGTRVSSTSPVMVPTTTTPASPPPDPPPPQMTEPVRPRSSANE